MKWKIIQCVHTQKYVARQKEDNYLLNTKKLISILYFLSLCEREATSAHTHNTKFYSLSGEGCRRGWEGRVKNGVRMKHMITLE